MLHAISYCLIALFYVAVLCGLDKSVAIGCHAAIYLLMGLIGLVAKLRIARWGGLFAVLALVGALQMAEDGSLMRGEDRPVVFYILDRGRQGAR